MAALDTFIHIHDFLIAESCKKTAAALLKEAPQEYNLPSRKNSNKGSHKLLEIVQAKCELGSIKILHREKTDFGSGKQCFDDERRC